MFELLIVDDEISSVENLATTIDWQEIGIEAVHKAYSAPEALQLVEHLPINIIITDVRMPVMSGLELIERVKSLRNRIHSIVLSGYDDFAFVQTAMRNQADDYLLKPVRNSELVDTVRKVMLKLRSEWEEAASMHRAMYSYRENLPMMRSFLLQELLERRMIPSTILASKMESLQISFQMNKECALLLIRLEDMELIRNSTDLALTEFSLLNILEDIIIGEFYIWSCKDAHDYLIALVQLEPGMETKLKEEAGNWQITRRNMLHQAVTFLQKSVESYLKESISVIISDWFPFPEEIADTYQETVSNLRRKVGDQNGLLLAVDKNDALPGVRSLKYLYEPPTLFQLLDAGRWDDLESKLSKIFEELESPPFVGQQEYLLEVYYLICSALVYFAHKNGSRIMEFVDSSYLRLALEHGLNSVQHFRTRTLQVIGEIREVLSKEQQEDRISLVQRVQRFVEDHLSSDASLQNIADHVSLHPAYLSRIYKLETGENLSDHILKVRMEKAAFMLKNTDEKIHMISEKLGYLYPPYFAKVFKKFYGLSPQEYRNL